MGEWEGVAAVDGNLLSDIGLVENVKFVMRSGVFYEGALAK